jgi:hypothetical protein
LEQRYRKNHIWDDVKVPIGAKVKKNLDQPRR